MNRTMPLILVALVAVGCLAGCGGSGPFEYQPVAGKITYEDGQPISTDGLQLYFTAQVDSPDGESFPRVAMAHVDGAGEFKAVTSYKYGDGLVPAEHKVTIKVGPGPGGKPLVAKEYTDAQTTPLSVDSNGKDFLEIKVPRP
jgi:predicted small lipoprotein YifL